MTWEAFDFPRRFGPYVLVFPLGVGGMGNVFLAMGGRAGPGKPCVLKRLIPENARDAERVARLRREAALAGRLSHGSIVTTLGIDEIDGEPVIVQEFLQGRTLTQVLSAAQSAATSMAVEVAVHIVREVAGALAYAHQVDGGGVVHRDISPENIMVTFGGGVRLIDFGIARAPNDPALTQAGFIVGRESYIAPEILRGGVADARADIYSLGVVLWELLSGSQFMSVERKQRIAPSAVARRPGVPPELDAVVLKALAPADSRFQHAEDLAQVLASFLPPGFLGKEAISALLGRCYDVDAEERRLTEALEQAKELLEPAPLAGKPAPPRRRVNAGALIILGAVAAAAVTAGASWSHYRLQTGAAVSAPVAVAPKAGALAPSPPRPALPAEPAPAASSPALAPQREVEKGPPEAEPSPSRVRSARSYTAPRSGAEVPLQTAAESIAEARDSLQAGEPAAAERQARRSLDGASAAEQAQAHVIIGKTFIVRRRWSEAKREFELAIRLDPANRSAASELAQLRAQLAAAGEGE